ncbi:MAG: type II secretion system F family protein [Puniceicoccales bacterium]
MKTNTFQAWRIFLVRLSSPVAPERTVEVLAPNADVAIAGCGKAPDEQTELIDAGGFDTALRTKTAGRRPAKHELARFFQSMSRCMASGASTAKALQLSALRCRTPVMRGVLGALWMRISHDGIELSEAAESFPEIFQPMHVALLRIGESMGETHRILDELARIATETSDLEQKLASACIYPSIILLIFGIVVSFAAFSFIPTMGELLTLLGVEMPLYNRLVVASVMFVTERPWLILGPLILAAWMVSARRRLLGADFVQRAQLKLPVLGRLFAASILVRTTRAMALLLGSGVAASAVFPLIAKVSANCVYRDYYLAIHRHAQAGNDLSQAFMIERKRIGPDGLELANCLQVGSFSGEYGAMLHRFAEEKKKDLDFAMEYLPRMIEPIVLLVGAVLVVLLFLILVGPNLAVIEAALKS